MVKEIEQKYMCYSCKYLNKDRKQDGNNNVSCFRYGCDNRKDAYICGWIRKDSELKTMGCSDWKSNWTLKFGDLFRFKNYIVLYLGLYKGKRLLYNMDYKSYKLVDNDWFRNMWCKNKIKSINIVTRYGRDKMCKDLREKYEKQNRR